MGSPLDLFAEAGAATVHEAQGRRGAMDSAITPLSPAVRMCGRAYPVDAAPADNLAVQIALTRAAPGDVLVVDAKGYVEAGAWGDILALAAQVRGLAGLVIDGSVRDSQEIVAMGFPVFSRGVCIKGTTKLNAGRQAEPVTCGGVVVRAGDVVVGDADGVVVVPADDVERVAEAVVARLRKEETYRERLRAGENLLDVLGRGGPT